MGTEPPQFDDPALKAALKARLGAERAPDELRARLTRLMAEDNDATMRMVPAPDAAPRPSARPNTFRLWGMTPLRLAAAILLFGSALTTYFLLRPATPPPLERDVLAALVETHNVCCTHDFHKHPAIDQQNFATMKAQAAARLNHPVVATAVPGWTFQGLYLCPVGDNQTKSAHLLFQRGQERLSIFTVADPHPSDKTRSNAIQIDDRFVTAIATNGTTLGVVAHPKSPALATEVERLLKDHADEIARRTVALLALVKNSQELLH